MTRVQLGGPLPTSLLGGSGISSSAIGPQGNAPFTELWVSPERPQPSTECNPGRPYPRKTVFQGDVFGAWTATDVNLGDEPRRRVHLCQRGLIYWFILPWL